MNVKIDHYEALFNSKYFRWFDLNGEPALVEIVSVNADVEMTLPGGAKDKRPTMVFKQVKGKIDNTKPLVLNKTNGNEIAKIHGVKPSAWIGKQIVLFQAMTKLRGEPKDCVRVRAKRESK